MKKLSILLALLLALSCVPALAAQGDAILGNSEEEPIYFNYCFTAGDTLYLATYNEIYTYRVGDADLQRYEFDLPELPEGSYEVTSLPFSDGDKVYAVNLITQYDDSTEFYGASISEVSFPDAETAALGATHDADWSSLVGSFDGGSYPITPEAILGLNGQAFIRYYDDLGDHRVGALDIASGKFRQIDALEDAYTFLPYKDGALLAELYNAETDATAVFVAYDPASGSLETLGEIPIEDYTPLMGLAYDPATDTVYCAKAGEICPVDLRSGEIGEGLTDMPLEAYGSAPACILEGGYYAYCSTGMAIRNLDPEQKAQSRLKINDTFWNETVSKAYYRFVNARGDVSVVLSREYSEVANIRDNMMNRDSSIDIYVINTSSVEYDALFDRGYLMELDGSEKAKALAERMYPSIRDSVSTDGRLVAVPLSMYAWTLGINEKALNALGVKLEEVPDDWPGFLDFLAGLTGKLGEDSGVHLFYSGCTVSEARYDLMMCVLEDYERYTSHAEVGLGYNTGLLRGILDKVEALDLEALGCAADEDVEYDDALLEEYGEETVLLQTSSGCSIGNFYSEFMPVLMRVSPDAPAYLELEATVLVVNPYTQNPEAALAFIDEVIDDLPSATLYGLDPSLSEPIRGEANEASLKEIQNDVSDLKAEYEQAGPEDKQYLEEEIRQSEETLAYVEENLWDVSPEELVWFRAHDDNVVVADYNWLYSEDAGEAQELLDQYRDGQIGLDELLSGIDSKVQMMLLEGN